MDQNKFLELLKGIQTPDTEIVKASTTELRKTYYPNPQSLLWLLHILTSHDAPEVRQQAAVEALRLISKHWVALPEDQKPAIRERLFETTLNETKPLVRHSAARVIASIAAIDLEDGQWASLPQSLFQASTSDKVAHREVGIYTLFSLLETAGDVFEDKLPGLFSLLSNTIKDPESPDVRVNTLLCLSRVAMLIQPDEDPENLARFQEMFPAMVAVLKAAIDEENDDRVMQSFEVFQTLLGCESALLNKHFKDLLIFMIDLGADTDIQDESRTQALSFLMQCARYRKMKIQGIRDMGENLTLKAMQIATEIDDDEDEDDVTPHKTALGLLDLLATSLPPRQVIVPLLKALPQYVNSDNPKYRQAGILSLGMCVEGAPDFIATQLDGLMPIVLKLLNDPVMGVRGAALNGVARLADDLAEELCKHHAELIPALLKNLDAATVQASSEAENEKNLETLKGACSALDSVTDGVDKETVAKYVPELVPRLVQLLNHEDLNVKASAAGAIGSIAGSAMDAFLPYFEGTMEAMSKYVTIKDSTEELDLRGIVTDSMGSMAEAVGPVAFQKYVQPLMQASEEGLNLGHARLRETSYILWSTLAKVYKEEFTPFLEGVVGALMASLNQEESDLDFEIGEEAREILGDEVVIAGKKVKLVTPATSKVEIDDLDNMEDDDDEDEDWDDLTAVTAVALEKEVAIEVLGDVLSNTRKNFMPYFEKAIETIVVLVEHSYEGVRKAAIGTLWRAYACLWALMEDHTGEKWTPGLPLKSQPSEELLKLGEVVTAATMSVWEDEVDRAVVTDINRNVSASLKLCGPAIMTQDKFTELMTSTVAAILTKSHPCQNDMGDEDDHDDLDEEESSEYDWLVIDTALDVIIGMAKALGTQFGELFKVYQKPITKFASSSTNYERSTAVGVIAECTRHMGAGVTPFTAPLLKLLIHKLTDEDPETKSNAAYALGLLIFHSTDSAAYLPSYNSILGKLEPLLQTQRARTLDNACGCVTRMIMAHPDKVPIGDILPVLVDLLPLKEDYEENEPIFTCIAGLYQHQNADVISLTPKLVPVFEAVLGEPAEQLEDETRAKVIATVKFIAEKNASLIQGHPALLAAVRG
ncbi:related to protein carrier KAP123 [Rhynchosporium graminicola]|uniref:Related to protein carrier KAP123 n=1 Tax=Rhynchosporium graminicola TaxID=2792576 RepID=A0A1E1KDJ5_9HELO|nr:related to protein carrier KAP123 [Rhynchosporium commune]